MGTHVPEGVTRLLPVAAPVLFHTMPCAPPFPEMAVKLKVPSKLVRLTAAAFVVVTLTSPTVSPVAPLALNGGSLPHNNMQPYLTLNFCIALQGIFPQRP